MNLLDDWRETCVTTDECSTGILKPLAHLWLNAIGRSRNYGCGCVQHDFDYRFGPRYEITRKSADGYLREYITAAGHSWIAAIVYFGLRLGGWKAWNNYRKEDGL